MASILTADEASRVVVVDPTDEKLADLLPQVDAYIRQATGRDWTQDNPICFEAKAAARLQLALIYDNAALLPSQLTSLRNGLISALAQLESIAAGLDAIRAVNSAMYAEDMQNALESDALGLFRDAYNRLLYGDRRNVAKAVFDAKPAGGYADTASIQEAFDKAVQAVNPNVLL